MKNQLNLVGGGEDIPASNQTRLIDMFPDDRYDTSKLIRIERIRRSTTAELRLLSQGSQLMYLDRTGFMRGLNKWSQETSLRNNVKFWTSYLIVCEGNVAQLWHLNARGDQDRHVCSIQPLDKKTPSL